MLLLSLLLVGNREVHWAGRGVVKAPVDAQHDLLRLVVLRRNTCRAVDGPRNFLPTREAPRVTDLDGVVNAHYSEATPSDSARHTSKIFSSRVGPHWFLCSSGSKISL